MSANDGFQDVSKCYVFKSRLQEYAQKVGLPTPIYETLKEGPSHEPLFRSTVTVNDVRYDSLSGFFNRKAAEQSAAEVALVALAQTEDKNECISLPVNETGLCKNLLQEFAQKMNYAMPSYSCTKDETPAKMLHPFSCTVNIGGINYIGAASKTKKEAEIKAARTALLAIQMSAASEQSIDKPLPNSTYTVLPFKKKGKDSGLSNPETTNILKVKKKTQFKKKHPRKTRPGMKTQKPQLHNGGSLDPVSCEEPIDTQLQIPSPQVNSGTVLPFHGDDMLNSSIDDVRHENNNTSIQQNLFSNPILPCQDNHKDQTLHTELDTPQSGGVSSDDP